MKAVVFTRYGSPDYLRLQEVEKPTPKDNQVLIRIYTTTVTTGDCETRTLSFPLWIKLPFRLLLGVTRPRKNTVLGTELAGEIEAVGKAVTRWKVGDQVFGSAGLRFGTNAEYKCLPEDEFLALKPAAMTYEEAVTLPFGACDALHFLRKGNIQSGQKVLVIGAGGSIGSYGVQLAKYYGAEVTGVDSAGKLDMLRSIGADHVVDYTQEDFTANGPTYDVIFDTVGKSPLLHNLKALRPEGCYLLANPIKLLDVFRARLSGRKVIIEQASHRIEDLQFVKELAEARTIKAAIDRTYPLEELADAHRYVETGQKKGNVIVTIAHPDQSS